MKYIFLCIAFCLSCYSQSKITLSKKAEISILTCAPGNTELYTYFGHSAIRVKDKINHIDKVYNYGMFDFSAPNFYLNFCRGKLLYKVVGYDYKYFPYQYYTEKRSIKSQILNLTNEENQKVFNYLEWNIKPENKNYYYDFFYDNCATKMYEVIEKSIGEIKFDYNKFPINKTHRNLIHMYLPNNSWSKFGIDLALGSVIDKKASFKEYMFLPDYTSLGFKNSTIGNKKLIVKENYILKYPNIQNSTTNLLTSPILASTLILLVSIFFFIKKYRVRKVYFNGVSILFGLLGVILLSLWFLTEHTTTKVNLNILWCSPFLTVLPFVNSKYQKIISYLGITTTIIFLGTAILKVQEYDISFFILATAILPIYLNKLLSFKI